MQSWNGWISDDKWIGIRDSYQDIVALDVRTSPKTVKLAKALLKDSGSVVVDQINCMLTTSNQDLLCFGNAWNIYVSSSGVRQKIYTHSNWYAILGCAEYNGYVYWATIDKLHRTDLASISTAIASGTLTPTAADYQTFTGITYSNWFIASYTTDSSTILKTWEKIYCKNNFDIRAVAVSDGTTSPTKAYLEEVPNTAAIAFNSLRLYTTADLDPVNGSAAVWTERQPHWNTNQTRQCAAVSTDWLSMYACASWQNLQKSVDGWVSWTQALAQNVTAVSVSWDWTKVIASKSGTGKIYTSSDSGVTWYESIPVVGTSTNDTITYTSTSDWHTINLGTWSNTAALYWFKVTTNKNLILTSVTKNSSCTATTCYLKADGWGALANAAFSWTTATFSYPLTTGTTYRIELGSGWAWYTARYWASSYPKAWTNINLVWWSTNWADTGDNNYWNITAVGSYETTPATTALYTWAKIYAKNTEVLQTVTVDSNCTATTAYIYASDWTTLLTSATITASVSTLNYLLTSWTTYYVLVGSGGSDYASYWQSITYPSSKTNINFTGGYDWTTDSTTILYNIKTITTATSASADWRVSKVSRDGSQYLAMAYGGRAYTGTTPAVWTEIQPDWAANKNWTDWRMNYTWDKFLAMYNGSATVYKSVDTWANWTTLSSWAWATGNKYVSASDNTSIIIVGSASSAYLRYSKDYGANFAAPTWAASVAHTSVNSDYNWIYLTATTWVRAYKSVNLGANVAEIQPAGNVDKAWAWIALSSGVIPLETVAVSTGVATFTKSLSNWKYYNVLFDKEGSARDPSYKAQTFPLNKTDINYISWLVPNKDTTNGWAITSIGSTIVSSNITHPMLATNLYLYIGDGRYVASMQDTVYTAQTLALPDKEFVYYLTINGAATRVYTRLINQDFGKCYYWDWVSTTIDQVQELEGLVRNVTTRESVDYIIMGYDPILYYYPFQKQQLKKLNNLSSFPYNMITYNNLLLFWRKGWVYSWWALNKNYPDVLSTDYKTSNDNETDDITCIHNSNGTLYVAWKNWVVYGVDKLSTTNYVTSGKFTTRVFYGTVIWKNKYGIEGYLCHTPLLSWESIEIYEQTNLAGGYVLKQTITWPTTLGITKVKLNWTYLQTELKFIVRWPWTSTPEILDIFFRCEESE